MTDTTLTPALTPTPEELARVLSRVDPSWKIIYETMPSGITLKPDVITLKHNIAVASTAVMILTSFLLFWIPFFNGLFAGALGGFHAGRMKRALGAAVVTSVAVPALLAFASFISQQPALRFLSGFTFWQWVALHVIGTFMGAVGGAAFRPLVTERSLDPYFAVSSSPYPGSTAVPVSSRSELPAVPPSEPVREG